jgi:hypothetical protein
MEEIDQEAVNAAVKRCNDFFMVNNIPLPPIKFAYSREEMDTIVGRKTESWVVARAQKEGLYFIHPTKIEEITPHTSHSFQAIVIHEFAHWYTKKITGIDHGIPRWFHEGLANIVARCQQSRPKPIEGPAVDKYYNFDDKDIYPWGFWMVKYLMEEFGHKELIRFIKSFVGQTIDKESFAVAFQTFYGFNVDELQNKAMARFFPEKEKP